MMVLGAGMRRRGSRTVAAWFGVGLAGCQPIGTVIGEQTLPLYGFEGRWVAALAAEPVGCEAASHAVLTIGQQAFALDPFQSTIVIRGSVDQSGVLIGSMSRAGPNKQALSIGFTGQTGTDANGVAIITAAMHSGPCTWRGGFRRA